MDQTTAQPGAPAPRREPGTLRIGQIAGVDVLVRSSWLLVAGLIAVLLAPKIDSVEPGLGGWKYVAGVAFAVLLYLSVLLHEMSHALMAKRYGLPVRSSAGDSTTSLLMIGNPRRRLRQVLAERPGTAVRGRVACCGRILWRCGGQRPRRRTGKT